MGGAVGPVVTGYIFDITGGYQAAFLVCAAFCVFSTILVAIIGLTKKPDAGI
jgi:cyanate permease